MGYSCNVGLGAFSVLLIATISNTLSLPAISRDSREMLFHEAHLDGTFESQFHVMAKRALPADQYKMKYVSLGGIVSNTTSSDATSIEVAVTSDIPDDALDWAARVVARMTRFMPAAVFAKLCADASVGIFTAKDTALVYPEYASLRSTPECQDSCTGKCSGSCTFDGRKWSTVAGLGGSRAVILLDNLMCTAYDWYYGQFSGLVHEFGHVVHRYGIASAAPEYMDRISAAYENAKKNETWVQTSYAMSTVYEYFACFTGAFFNTDATPYPATSGGMNTCGVTSGNCPTEKQARAWLKQQDPVMFDILTYAYTNRKMPSLFLGGITICPPKPYNKKYV